MPGTLLCTCEAVDGAILQTIIVTLSADCTGSLGMENTWLQQHGALLHGMSDNDVLTGSVQGQTDL